MRAVLGLFLIASILGTVSCSSSSTNETSSGGTSGMGATGGGGQGGATGGSGGTTGGSGGSGGIVSECNQTGYSCQTPPPDWSFVAYAETPETSCPAGFGQLENALSDVSGAAATCSCTCTEVSPATCTKGTVGWARSSESGCNQLAASVANDGTCHGDEPTSGLVPGVYSKISTIPIPTQGSCSGQGKSDSVPAVQIGVDGRVCMAAASCKSGAGTCLPPVSAPFESCVSKAGDVACPTGFPSKTLTGSSVDDKRSCGPCTCGTEAACGSPSMQFFSDETCNGNLVFTVTNLCAPEVSAYPQSWKVIAPVVNPSCVTTSPPQAIGEVSMSGTRTICCAS